MVKKGYDRTAAAPDFVITDDTTDIGYPLSSLPILVLSEGTAANLKSSIMNLFKRKFNIAMSISFVIMRKFRRRRPKENTDDAKHNIKKKALSIHSDINNLIDENVKMKRAVELTMYDKVAAVAYKAKALERMIQVSKISSEEKILFLDDRPQTICRVSVERLRRVASFLWDLPIEYTEALREMVISDKPVHLSKIIKYMPA